MDNKAPEEFKAAIQANGSKVKLVSPDTHIWNIAGLGIQTYKNPSIFVFSWIDDSFLIHQWDLIVCNVCTKKAQPNWTQAMMYGDQINYPDGMKTPIASLLLIKTILNSVISLPGAQFANADISNFYLMTPLKQPAFSKIKTTDIPMKL